MRRKVIEILREKGFVFTDKQGFEVLYYCEDNDGIRIWRKKPLTSYHTSQIEVEHPWVEKPIERKRGQAAVVMNWCISNSFLEKLPNPQYALEDQEERVYYGILIRLLADERDPKSAVHICVEKEEMFTYVRGVCIV